MDLTQAKFFHLANSIKELEFIMGNHDYWFGFGLPSPIPNYMNDDEVAHHKWTHTQIGESYRNIVQTWKFVEELKLKNDKIIKFQHYGYDEKSNWFKDFVKQPNSGNLDHLFIESNCEMIFYGHNHEASDIQGISRYINLGSAGCYSKSEVRLGVLDIIGEKIILKKFSVVYDDEGLMEDYVKRNVPAKEFITSTFITRLKGL